MRSCAPASPCARVHSRPRRASAGWHGCCHSSPQREQFSRAMNPAYTCGNAGRDGKRGWFIGQFVAPELGLRHRHDVEIKWGVHPRGEARPGSWVSYRVATTIAVLIRGEILIRVRCNSATEDIVLAAEGDYIILPPIIEHTWQALTDCVVLTVRSPSIPDDVLSVEN